MVIVIPNGKVICVNAKADAIKEYLNANSVNRSQITCFRCGEQGHYKSECFHWQTRLCWHFSNTYCKDANCSFAHGKQQLRTPWMSRCVRLIRRDSQLITLGCKEYGHTYKNCPYLNEVYNFRHDRNKMCLPCTS